MDVHRAVVAYELFDRSTAANAHSDASDHSLVFSAINHIGHELLPSNVLLFINCTHESLSGAHLHWVQPEKVVLEVGPIAGHLAQDIAAMATTLTQLRERGFRLAFNHVALAPAYAAWRPLADYVKLDLGTLKPEQLAAYVATVKSRTKAQIVAEKVETQEQFSAMQAYGVTLFQGYWLAHPDVVKVKVVAPGKASVATLCALMRQRASAHEMENVLKKDAVLGFSVLRLAHACSTGQGQPIPSFHNALMCLGEPKLTRWTHLLQGNCGNSNSGPSAVVTTAVVRGRMMELLAQPVLTQEECETAYLVGIFSLLEELLGLSKDEAMALLPLPAAASEALRYGTGLYGPMLALTKACESEDDAAYSAAAAHLNFSSHHINMSHMQALVWADTVAA
jgi:EAL and modified HD-GYP domain-containing signal transduction protein